VLPARAPPARLPSPCSPAARPLRAGALSAQEGGVHPSRRRRRCRQPASESAPGATLTWLSHRPSAPRYTSGANREARPATRSRGSCRAGYPRPSTRSAPPPMRSRCCSCWASRPSAPLHSIRRVGRTWSGSYLTIRVMCCPKVLLVPQHGGLFRDFWQFFYRHLLWVLCGDAMATRYSSPQKHCDFWPLNWRQIVGSPQHLFAIATRSYNIFSPRAVGRHHGRLLAAGQLSSVTFAMVAIVEYSIGSVHHARRRLKILGAGREQHPCRHVPRHVNARGRQHGSLCLEAHKFLA